MNRRTLIASTAAAGGCLLTNPARAVTPAPKFFTVPGDVALHVRRMGRRGGKPVLYIHGATFSTALSVGYRFSDGVSWEDSLYQAGLDVWSLDFEGFGGSARPPSFSSLPQANPPALRSTQAVDQIARAVTLIKRKTRKAKINLLAHSWGGVPTASFAASFPEQVDRMVLFAPALNRPAHPAAPGTPTAMPPTLPAWRYLGVADQLARFGQDTPVGHASVLAEPTLANWGPTWLATDPTSSTRTPPSVQIPMGPQADIMALWTGNDLYDPQAIAAPTLVVRGEWDSVCSAADVARLVSRMKPSLTSTVTIPTSGHLAHLETNRALLWAAANDFLLNRSAP